MCGAHQTQQKQKDFQIFNTPPLPSSLTTPLHYLSCLFSSLYVCHSLLFCFPSLFNLILFVLYYSYCNILYSSHLNLICMLNLQRKRSQIKPSAFFDLILEPISNFSLVREGVKNIQRGGGTSKSRQKAAMP